MSHNHGQQPPYSYQQHSNGPSQPPWQADPNRRTGWQDPRFQSVQPSAPSYQPTSFGPISGQPLPPPPQHPYPNPNPAAYPGPPPAVSQQYHDTAGWGVKYNHTQPAQPGLAPAYSPPTSRPALPPRPSSRLDHENAPPVTSSWNRPALVPQADGTWQFPHLIPQQPKPPTPPPRPPASILQSHFPQSSQSSIHAQPAYPSWTSGPAHPQYGLPHIHTHEAAASTYNQSSHISEGTVSPIEDDRKSFSMPGKSDSISVAGRSDTVSPMPGHRHHASKTSASSISVPHLPGASVSATAFGPGQLSDWQHYSYDGTDIHGDDVHTPVEKISKLQEPVSPRRKPSKHVAPSKDPNPISVPVPTEVITPPPPPPPSQPLSQPAAPVAVATQADAKSEPDYADRHTQSPIHSSPERTPASHSQADDDSTQGSISSIRRTGTIDSVINAWTAPVDIGGKIHDVPQVIVQATTPTPPNEIEQIPPVFTDEECQTDFPPEVITETKIETRIETKIEIKEVEVEVDPYADLKNEYSATLKRFAGMLRQESQAGNDDDKFMIFQSFVTRELRLRSVLYGVDLLPVDAPKKTEQPTAPLEFVASSATPNIGTASTPEIPKVSISTTSQTANTPQAPAPDSEPPKIQPTAREKTPTPTPPSLLSIPQKALSSSKDDTFVVVNAEGNEDGDDDEYSPGGRPRMLHNPRPKDSIYPQDSVTAAKSDIQSISDDKVIPISPGTNAPMTLDDYVMPDRPESPIYDAPIVVTAEDIARRSHLPSRAPTVAPPLKFQPPRPTYTPFRHGDRPVSPLPPVKEHDPTETYNSMRQTQAAESGRLLSNEVPTPIGSVPGRDLAKTPSGGRQEHEEAFIGLIRRESKAMRKKPSVSVEQPAQLRAGTPARNVASPALVTPLTKAVRSLRALIPKTLMSEASANPLLEPLTTGLSRMPDEFGFINTTVVAWDLDNKKIRARLDSERLKRQSKNEERIDQLFNDNEIGYADIGALEAEFKLNEASKKYQEDKAELDGFISGVYDKVVYRVEAELGEVGKLQVKASELLLDSSSQASGKRVQSTSDAKPDTGKVSMTEVMDLVLQLHGKAETRHQKIAEAQFERERRRKRLELSVLYTNGDTPAVKKLEQEFNDAQLRHVIEEAQKKDDRANKLMDYFDRAVVRGLAENQAWIDEVQTRFELVRDLMHGSDDNKPVEDTEREALLYGVDGLNAITAQTQTTLELILTDSQKLVRLSNIADKILNEADYGMFLAQEKLAKSPPERFEKLKQDKIKEDDKIREELEVRISGVEKAPEELANLIRSIKLEIGVDEGHKARLEKALQEAKRRNERSRGDSVSSPILSGAVAGPSGGVGTGSGVVPGGL